MEEHKEHDEDIHSFVENKFFKPLVTGFIVGGTHILVLTVLIRIFFKKQT